MNGRQTLFRASLMAMAIAAASVTQGQSLDTLYENALSHDTDLGAAQANRRAAATRITESLSVLRPQVNLEAETGPSYGRDWAALTDGGAGTFDDDGSLRIGGSTRLVLSQNLYNAQAAQAYESVRTSDSASEYQVEAARADLQSRVIQGYIAVLQARERARLSQRVINTVQRQLEQTQERYDVGLVAITDVLEAQAALDQARADQVDADNQVTLARQDLSRITGVPVDNLPTLSASFSPSDIELGPLQEWINRSRQNPALVAQRLSVESQEQSLTASERDNLPVISARASWDYEANVGSRLDQYTVSDQFDNEFNDQTGITLALTATYSLPVFDSGRRQAGLDRQSHQIAASRAELDGRIRQIEQNVQRLYQQLEANRSRLRALEQVVSSRESAAEATEVGYEVGSRNIVEVLNAQQALLSARTDLSLARHSFLADYLQLQQVSGTLNENDIEWVMGYLN